MALARRLRMISLLLAISTWLLPSALSVDRHKFKKCSESSPCRRYRSYISRVQALPDSLYTVDPSSVAFDKNNVTLTWTVSHRHHDGKLQGVLQVLEGGALRVTVDEVAGLRERYRLPKDDAIVDSQLRPQHGADVSVGATESAVSFGCWDATAKSITPGRVVLQHSPFKLAFYVRQRLVQVVNGDQLMNLERYRKKEEPPPPPQPPAAQAAAADGEADEEGDEGDEQQQQQEQQEGDEGKKEAAAEAEGVAKDEPEAKVIVDAVSVDADGAWEESFGGHRDSRPHGPSAVGVDVAFIGVEHVYGLPEHAAPMPLPSYPEPYRFFNLDVFEYELDNEMALYGTVPHLVAIHDSPKGQPPVVTGFLWTNPSESWAKLMQETKEGDLPTKYSWWVAETGVMDFFVFLGPTPMNVMKQFHSVAGLPTMPPLFALGKHQCRWNYKDEADVFDVDSNFDKHDIPYDVIWLDIEHTDGKKYFTWNNHLFPKPAEMIDKIAAKGRKMVTIVDPHIKKDDNYYVYRECRHQDLFVKKPDGTQYEGWCWPGSSFYPDFTNPQVRDFWASLFDLSRYEGSTKDLFIWNDMNEPSVFNGPEVSMQRDIIHYGQREHREVHNLYGMYYHRATFEGLTRRDPNQRPFVLTRSFFIGTHRYGYVWTGDNAAEWSHLEISIPMLLSHALGGISYIGADVGGFFKNPEPELLYRWHQLGIWYPFYRAHAHLETARREPWLFGQEVTDIIRDTVTTRYRMLPYLYTATALFAMRGEPIIRPLWFDNAFISDPQTYTISDQMMVGGSVMVKAVTQPMAKNSTAAVYLPENPGGWYDFYTGARLSGGQTHVVSLSQRYVPTYVRAGSVLVSKGRRRRSSTQQRLDPFTVDVYPSDKGEATGLIYEDDHNSWAYKKGEFLFQQLDFRQNTLTAKSLPLPLDDKTPTAKDFTPHSLTKKDFTPHNLNIESIRVHGAPASVSECKAKGAPVHCRSREEPRGGGVYVVAVKKPPVKIGEEGWTVTVGTAV